MLSNKYSYFTIMIVIKEKDYSNLPVFQKNLKNAVNHVLYNLNVDQGKLKNLKAYGKDGKIIVHVFKINNIKRIKQFKNFCELYLPQESTNYKTQTLVENIKFGMVVSGSHRNNK